MRGIRCHLRALLWWTVGMAALHACSGAVRAQGVALTGVGPVNRSMAGASTAAPIDAMGALHWNPASIAGLNGSEVAFGLELLLPTEEVSSAVTTPFPMAGTDGGEPGVSVIPATGWVHKSDDSRWAVGLGMYAIGGFRTNFPASSPLGTANPVLFPQAMGGVGRFTAEAEFMQIAPTLAYVLTDKLSVGIAPTVTLGRITLDPLFIAPPVPGLGYTSGCGTRWHWGGGVQAGVYYIATPTLHLGASIKSPQWFEDFRYFTEDGLGGTRQVTYDVDYPMIVSLGAAYTGFENLLIATDVRFFDYKSADGFGAPGTFVNGALAGLDWSSIVSVSTGIQYRLTESWFVRTGYTYMQNPIKSSETFVNIASPLIVEHGLTVGLTCQVSSCLSLSATYVHGFENSRTGPLPLGGTVTSTVSADAASFGVTVKY